MQHYMTQTEIIATLQVQAEIDPSLTCLVWQKLEEQNANFFLSYSACLRLKDQIVSTLAPSPLDRLERRSLSTTSSSSRRGFCRSLHFLYRQVRALLFAFCSRRTCSLLAGIQLNNTVGAGWNPQPAADATCSGTVPLDQQQPFSGADHQNVTQLLQQQQQQQQLPRAQVN